MLGIIDEQQPNPGALGGKQISIRSQRLQGRTDKIGRAQGRNRGLWRGGTDRGAQQHHLLVLLSELPRGHPLAAPGQPPDALQLDRIDTALRTPGHQVAQFGGEPDRGERGPQFARPGMRAVVEITGEQFTDDPVLLGSGDQPRRWISGARGRIAQYPEGVAVHRTDQGFAHHRQSRGAGV